MPHKKWWLYVVSCYLYKNNVHDRIKHALLPPKRLQSRKGDIFSLFRGSFWNLEKNSRIREFGDQKLPDPGVWRSKTLGSGSFETQNIRILLQKKLKIASKIFLKGRIDEKKKLAYAQWCVWSFLKVLWAELYLRSLYLLKTVFSATLLLLCWAEQYTRIPKIAFFQIFI